MNRRRWIKKITTVCGAIVFCDGVWPQSLPNPLNRKLRFTISLTNSQARELGEQILWFYMPMTQTATQSLSELRVSMAYERSSDALGHTIIKLVFPRFAPLATKLVSIAADVVLFEKPLQEILVNPDIWLGSEKFIETNDIQIQSLAASLKMPDRLETAKAIYDWVRGNLQYAGYVADDLGALYALRERRGDCTEYADLAVALARANGIPARMLGGFVTDRDTAPRAEEYHNWAEVYLNGAWQLLDAQKERWLRAPDQYIGFRIYQDKAISPIELSNRYKMQGDLQVSFN
ncbi:MAG: hypothetical protein JWN23_2571 [Rhodocyclales bacterium]|nr:hypothetical protein [Rhodocyclales bacterium]